MSVTSSPSGTGMSVPSPPRAFDAIATIVASSAVPSRVAPSIAPLARSASASVTAAKSLSVDAALMIVEVRSAAIPAAWAGEGGKVRSIESGVLSTIAGGWFAPRASAISKSPCSGPSGTFCDRSVSPSDVTVTAPPPKPARLGQTEGNAGRVRVVPFHFAIRMRRCCDAAFQRSITSVKASGGSVSTPTHALGPGAAGGYSSSPAFAMVGALPAEGPSTSGKNIEPGQNSGSSFPVSSARRCHRNVSAPPASSPGNTLSLHSVKSACCPISSTIGRGSMTSAGSSPSIGNRCSSTR